jgi:hypothetical protein
MRERGSRWHHCFLPQDYFQRLERDQADQFAGDPGRTRLDSTVADDPAQTEPGPTARDAIPPDNLSQDEQAASPAYSVDEGELT